ncbi:MAG: M48 family metallopeptidase [bacterium]
MTRNPVNWYSFAGGSQADGQGVKPCSVYRLNPPESQYQLDSGKIFFTLGERQITCRVRRSKRARQLKLKITFDNDLEITVPPDYPIKELDKIILKKASWIKKNLDRKERSKSFLPLIEKDNNLSAIFLGEYYPLIIRKGINALELREERLILTSPADAVSLSPQHLNHALACCYRSQAERIIPERVKQANQNLGFEFAEIRIKDQKSRWGSCSEKGNVNFNWRLVMAPLPVLDYVVFHELMHLKELNHSPRFWNSVEDVCPDYRQHRLWLKTYGGGLLHFAR